MNWIFDKITSFGDQAAFVCDAQSVSYRELLSRVTHWQERLSQHGIAAGSVVAVVGDYSLEAVSLILALLITRAVVVPLTSDTRARHSRFFELAGVEVAFELSGDLADCKITPLERSLPHAHILQLRHSGEAGFILFTSGTSGESKGVVLGAERLFKKFREARHRPDKALRSLVFLKLDHIGGINTLFAILLSGGTAISIDTRTPTAVCRAIERHRVELLPTTPTFLNMLLLSEIYKAYDLSSVRMITYGTEPMPASTLRAVNTALPAVKFKQTYGLTELGILSTRSKQSDSDWMTIGGDGVQTRVVDDVLHIRAETAMLGYLNAPSPFTADGWYVTGDRVERDGDYYRVLGRESEIINVGGEKVYPAEVESALLDLQNVRDVLVRGQPNPVTGQIVVAHFILDEPEDRRALQIRVHEYCRDRLEPFKIPKLVKIADKEFTGARLKKMRNLPLED